MSRTTLAHVALFVVNLIYGANYVVAKGLMPEVLAPSGFILLRVLGATLLFWVVRVFRPERIATSDFVRFLLCAITGVAMNQLFFFHGLMRTSPVNASIIMVATPILVLVISGVLIGERITRMKVIGIALGALGALYLLAHRSDTGIPSSLTGDLFVLINASSFAVYLVLVKPLMHKYSAITVMAWVFGIGALLVLPFGTADLQDVAWSTWSMETAMAVLFVVVAVTFVAYLLNTWALRHVNPSVVGTFIYLQPLLALVFGWSHMRFVLDVDVSVTELVGPVQVISALAIFTGVHLVNRADARRS